MGIRINAVAPGNILFEGSVWERKISENKREVEEFIQQEVSLGRLGSTKDVSNLVAYLASPLSSFITGSVLVIDGGQVRS
jgi:3-oxoacyl-[acyl-carrier protein] reductase